MSAINIIKASAGSGKTFQLTLAFLQILMKEPTDYYKSVLAVTFTNKATEEMKARIIQELHNLASGGKSNYLDELINESKFKEDHIRNKSKAILQQILHGYSWFCIETIDTFFQRVLKAFARELSIPGNYKIEIETEPALKFAVDSLLEEIKEGSELLNWLIEFSEARIDEGKMWDIQNELFNLGQEVFKENFAAVSEEVYSSITDREKLTEFKKYLKGIISAFENTISTCGKECLGLIEKNGLEVADFHNGKNGITSFFKKLTDKQADINATVGKMLEGPEKWPSPKSDKKETVLKLAANSLFPLLNEIVKYINDNTIKYYTAKEIIRNLYTLGILADLSEKVKNYCRENNSFILSDSPIFINRIIDHNETPFIYEKVGNRYNHYMIDEFQDTSAMQWNNFMPLISNSLANGNKCLVVGDVKQSIYRWRNSNWEILAKQVQKDFTPAQTTIQSLSQNWRSRAEIINFNNLLYPLASGILQQEFTNNVNEFFSGAIDNLYNISDLYEGVKQTVANNKDEQGKVTVRFFEKEDSDGETEFYETALLDDINSLLSSGYNPGDIAILVRNKIEGKKIADLLIQKNSEHYFYSSFQVISNESLFLDSANSVNLIVAALQYMVNPQENINKEKLISCFFIANHSDKSSNPLSVVSYTPEIFQIENPENYLPEEFLKGIDSLLSLPLYELTERLISIFKLDSALSSSISELPYIYGFLDLVFEFTQNYSSDISKFLEFWNEDGIKRSISVSDSQNAVRILTIHKSKGLEFRAVIIPCCNWTLNQKPGTILWAGAGSEEFLFASKYPVNYTKSLLKTEFAPYYISELLKSYVDNLNLLYVATTRAVETLILYPQYKTNSKKEVSITTVGDLIYHVVNTPVNNDLASYFNIQDKTLEMGELSKMSKIEEASLESYYIESCPSGQAIDRLFCRYLSLDYFTSLTTHSENPARHGSVLHDILSEVQSKTELKSSFDKAVSEGLINDPEAEELLDYINSCFTNPLINSWYTSGPSVMNETDIILPEGITKRPDRVVIFDDHVDIIDYKFGSETNEEQYRKQIEDYKLICSQMGYSNIKGYLWYITLNKILEV